MALSAVVHIRLALRGRAATSSAGSWVVETGRQAAVACGDPAIGLEWWGLRATSLFQAMAPICLLLESRGCSLP